MKQLRCPMVAVLGHVDHGKTTLLDKIRGTAVASREPGRITQWIGASEVPAPVIERICGGLLGRLKVKVTLPGLLFIDTPGHEAFTNLRRRGGALADLAVLVVDINEGFMPQTLESTAILKSYKTPFMLAANKIDLLPGWRPMPGACFSDSFANQHAKVQDELNDRVYGLIGKLHDLGFGSERFDRVSDFREQVCIVPTSAKTGEGIPEVLAVLAGLAQRFLEEELRIEVAGPARATVLEVKEEVGLGTSLDAIIYDGTLAKGDMFAVCSLDKVSISRVRGLFQPRPLDEIRDPRHKFRPVDRVSAAAGVKIAAAGLEGTIAGAPLWAIRDPSEADELRREMQREMERLRISADIDGIVLKADALGSLEALERQFMERGVPIRKADIGDVSRRDVVEAAAVAKNDPALGAVVAFNVRVLDDAKHESQIQAVQIIRDNVIYRLIEAYEQWAKRAREELHRMRLKALIRPGKFALKPGFVFRRSEPAIVGVDVLGGVIKPKCPVMDRSGRRIGEIRELQRERRSLQEARLGDELAVSIDGAVIGRNVKEGDVLYVDVPSEHAIALRGEFRETLSGDELAALEEIIAIKRREIPTYGMM